MDKIWLKKSWPKDVPQKLAYRLGVKPLYEYLRANAKDIPNNIAYIYYGQEITWKELDRYSDSIANFLLSKGITKGDRVAIFMQNCPQYIIAHYAIQKIGAIVGPASPMFKKWELEYEVNDMGARAIFTTDDLYPIVADILEKTTLEQVILSNYADFAPNQPTIPFPKELIHEKINYPNTYDLKELTSLYKPEVPPLQVNIWDDIALMVYTSGSTGRPKGAMLTHGNALFKTAASYQGNRMSAHDIFLVTNPIFHIAGMVMGVNIPIYGANATILLTRYDPEAVITAIEKYNCSKWYSIVPMNVGILRYPGIEKRNLNSLNTNITTSFGIALTEEISNAWAQLTGGCLLYEASYGLSETHTCDTFMPWDKISYNNCGIPTFETDIRITDPETGNELPTGQMGEILIKSPGVFKGYWNNFESTQKTLRDGWVYTGDMGMIDEEGYLYFNGRLKEMIKCSGYSVFPEDVEVLLLKHAAIAQVAAIGIPDPNRGESVKAFIVLKEEYKCKITPEEIIQWSKEHMAAYKYPRYVEFMDNLPTSGTGKVLRRMLKEK
ncbi:AMP-binding protein [Desulfoscipio sp. XC116]|uniref:AMP-binding protein n=1 Tax=Desulfoscipio sp. XC116 TaxID=3144975 RepID=UPI00325B8073